MFYCASQATDRFIQECISKFISLCFLFTTQNRMIHKLTNCKEVGGPNGSLWWKFKIHKQTHCSLVDKQTHGLLNSYFFRLSLFVTLNYLLQSVSTLRFFVICFIWAIQQESSMCIWAQLGEWSINCVTSSVIHHSHLHWGTRFPPDSHSQAQAHLHITNPKIPATYFYKSTFNTCLQL